MKPYLFIDVDGVLNPDVRREGFKRYNILGYKVSLNPIHGRRLLSLAEQYDLVWATTWGELANLHIGPKIGLPELPVVKWSVEYPTDREYPSDVMFKTFDIIKYADSRSFAWIDDEIKQPDVEKLSNHDCFPLQVNSRKGISPSDFIMLKGWVDDLSKKEADKEREIDKKKIEKEKQKQKDAAEKERKK